MRCARRLRPTPEHSSPGWGRRGRAFGSHLKLSIRAEVRAPGRRGRGEACDDNGHQRPTAPVTASMPSTAPMHVYAPAAGQQSAEVERSPKEAVLLAEARVHSALGYRSVLPHGCSDSLVPNRALC